MMFLFYLPMSGCPLAGNPVKAAPVSRVAQAAAALAAAQPPGRKPPVLCMTQTILDADRKTCAVTGKQEKRVNDCGVPIYQRTRTKGQYAERTLKPGDVWSQCLLPERDPGVVAYKFCYADDAERCKDKF